MEDDSNGQESQNIHEPFTRAELIQQLADIDSDVTLLLTHAGTAIQALGQPMTESPSTEKDPGYGTLAVDTTPEGTLADLDAEERLETFKTTAETFLTTLHSIDVRLKRQFTALEEAGIISIKGSRGQGAEGSGADAVAKTTLEPDGVGKVGGLDVGWLNARSNKIERDMESELWTGMRKHLEDVVEGRIQVGNELLGEVNTEDATIKAQEETDIKMEG